MKDLFKYTLLFIGLLLSTPTFANIPDLINIYRWDYNAANKNWAVGQDEKGTVYIGNDIGLLEFDGIEWQLNQIPNSFMARSIAVLSHKTIFTGSYEEFGRWDRDISGKLVYTSLSDKLTKPLSRNDDFWKICIIDNTVYFQSFGSIYMYDYKSVKLVSEEAFLFLTKVRNELLVQKMNSAIYRLNKDKLEKIEGSDIFNNTDVRVILPFSTKGYLIGTTTKGIYIYDGTSFKELNPHLSAVMTNQDLNCGILTSRGTYLIGTILNGIYEIDIQGNILNHISSANKLQNNTVLSLFEDNLHNIWVALDRGLAYIQYMENINCYTDPSGNTGAIYDVIEWNGKLFFGTNQGVFYTTKEKLSGANIFDEIKLINGTQGQVWSFKIIDNRLYCCHNRGLREIHSDLSISEPYSISSGVFKLSEVTLKNKLFLLLSTYQSLIIIEKETGKTYKQMQIPEPIINADIDHMGNIWLEHFHRGIYKCQLKDDLSGFQNFEYYGGNSKDGLPYKMKIFKVGGRIMLFDNNNFFTYDDITNQIVPSSLLNNCFKDISDLKQIVPIADNMFWAMTNHAIYKFVYDGYKASIVESYNLGHDLLPVNNYENISIINDSTSFICLDNGFLMYKKTNNNTNVQSKLHQPYLKALQTSNAKGDRRYENLSKKTDISYNYNSLTFYFSTNNTFASNFSFQYMLKGVDTDWSTAQKINNVSYARLPKGTYTFLVRTVDGKGNYSDSASYEFEILPLWYQTFWAFIGYIILFVILLYGIWMLLLRHYRNLHLQKIRNREARRLRTLAGKLQNEVQQKNAELLTQTSFIIQKNELLLKIKDIIDEFYSKNKSTVLAPLYQKITTLLNNNMDSDDDWKTFLIKFEEKHTEFFKKMKTICPELTSSDLRLCACLKLNLETKEIASLMNLTVRAVENSRYRLRKKLKIQSSQNLNDFFFDIN